MLPGLVPSSRPARRVLAAAVSLVAAAALVVAPGSVASGSVAALDGVTNDSTDGHREARLPRIRGSVGPDFVISINKDLVPAGRYKLIVRDRGTIHNFRIMGTGVDERTGVPETGKYEFKIEVVAGTYKIFCGPHRSMRTSLTVT